MPIIARLAALYESRGIRIATGLNPSHFNDFPHAPFTWFIKEGESLTNGLGIALQEIYFLECLFARFQPRSLFAIGNSLGWSTLALGLLNPGGSVLAIDAGLDRHSQAGITFTNRVAQQEGVRARVVAGTSPQDVAHILHTEGMLSIEFAFIDGYHSTDQVQRDFRAVREHAAAGCVYLFHDVGNFALTPGIERIAADTGLAWLSLPATTSGMAIVYEPDPPPIWLAEIRPFTAPADVLALIRAAARDHRHRHLARWRRSLAKRLGKPGSGRSVSLIGEESEP
jgi:predicted O-methyltransferase YrrM